MGNLNAENFIKIKNFILKHGDKQTYSNMYNNNPHFSFGSFHIFLDPEAGQMNIDCNPEVSDFDEMAISDENGITFVVCREEKIMYDKQHEKRLEDYFSKMIDHIRKHK